MSGWFMEGDLCGCHGRGGDRCDGGAGRCRGGGRSDVDGCGRVLVVVFLVMVFVLLLVVLVG